MANKIESKLALQLREARVSANKVYAAHRISKKSQNGVLDEWLLNKPGDDLRSMTMELMELRCDGRSAVFCTQYQKKDWHARLRGGIRADAIVDKIVLNAVWLESGEVNMRAHEDETEQHRLLEAAPVATMTAVAGNRSQFRWQPKPIIKVIMRANTQLSPCISSEGS